MIWRHKLEWIPTQFNQARFTLNFVLELSPKSSKNNFENFEQFVKPEKAMNQFDSYLSQPDGHQLPQFGLLSSPIIRDKIIKKVRSHLLPHIFVK